MKIERFIYIICLIAGIIIGYSILNMISHVARNTSFIDDILITGMAAGIILTTLWASSKNSDAKERRSNEQSSAPASEQTPLSYPERQVRNFIDYTVNGLVNERSKTRTNSWINLTIGAMMNIAGVFILYKALDYQIFQNPSDKKIDIIAYVPRISFAVFVELFSFFFLRLYKRNLDDIKYLSNEITNIRCKALALYTSQISELNDITGNIAKEFSKTERNFILKKDESTVEIQKMRIESDEQAKLIENISAIFKRGENGKK